MKVMTFAALPLAALALAACDSQAEQEADVAEDQMEMQAEQSAVEAGPQEAALGMTEAQLIEAELVDEDGNELGEVEQVRRNAMGTVDGLVVELEDTPAERYVVVPMKRMVSRTDGDDTDVQTTMTAKQLAALPDAEITKTAP
ncbi:PRC-barrel domain-containing protein [Alteriqipengyuania sp. 357]